MENGDQIDFKVEERADSQTVMILLKAIRIVYFMFACESPNLPLLFEFFNVNLTS